MRTTEIMSGTYTVTRERITWTRWDARTLRYRTSHPYQWIVTESDGYFRCFDTRRDADSWIAQNS